MIITLAVPVFATNSSFPSEESTACLDASITPAGDTSIPERTTPWSRSTASTASALENVTYAVVPSGVMASPRGLGSLPSNGKVAALALLVVRGRPAPQPRRASSGTSPA